MPLQIHEHDTHGQDVQEEPVLGVNAFESTHESIRTIDLAFRSGQKEWKSGYEKEVSMLCADERGRRAYP